MNWKSINKAADKIAQQAREIKTQYIPKARFKSDIYKKVKEIQEDGFYLISFSNSKEFEQFKDLMGMNERITNDGRSKKGQMIYEYNRFYNDQGHGYGSFGWKSKLEYKEGDKIGGVFKKYDLMCKWYNYWGFGRYLGEEVMSDKAILLKIELTEARKNWNCDVRCTMSNDYMSQFANKQDPLKIMTFSDFVNIF